ncbi:MAG: type II toxin-antitoxin system RelE/ParE family toxin [Clostridiales bacterium]|nr:type II toxin-antitoxin system RelE/ParE family toxin [Clostridiales bacterium]
MAYNVIISERADELIDENVNYLLNKFKSPQAATHLLDGISSIYNRLEDNPFQFPDSQDAYLMRRHYKEALVPEMDYRIIFRVDGDDVYIVGLFHDLEDYVNKITE